MLAVSVLFNYGIGYALSRPSDDCRRTRSALLALGIAANLALIGVFKYTDFIVGTARALTGQPYELRHIVLPLAISFFTFNQIAYLADAYARLAEEYDVLNYPHSGRTLPNVPRAASGDAHDVPRPTLVGGHAELLR